MDLIDHLKVALLAHGSWSDRVARPPWALPHYQKTVSLPWRNTQRSRLVNIPKGSIVNPLSRMLLDSAYEVHGERRQGPHVLSINGGPPHEK